ncbi:tRNA lysidine(34) synthetase TilS [Virgibacillus salinus]|uniref:tRNA(Ile)-lysidine synthase n=1 Tax=Virgibacillus salinus TaxID=553311 RepID=A0A1H0XNH1_9BACI|nr:tRNA lysidine(34) synthetase TilS [Virgibacillus salinus]SDQ04186.1 tRNA(Ile)-lysidine synthase [Virgibacillus salinus]
MISKVNAFIKKNQLLKNNSTVLLGVSGGPDSMALLHYFQSIQEKWNLKLIVLSVDHQLRGDESRDDLDFVKHICEKWGVQFIGASLNVPSYKLEKQVGTQVAAREVRYEFFAKQMSEFNADYLALGHHGDDQVETMLMGLVRSATTKSLAGIPLNRSFVTGEIIRPFLCVTKDEIEDYCSKNRIDPRRDPSNEQTAYTRNYFRKELLPILKEKNSNIHTTTQYLSQSLQEDEQFLAGEAAKLVNDLVVFTDSDKEASFTIDSFKTSPRSLQRRAFHLILNYLYKELPKNLSYVHEEQFFALLESDSGNVQIDFPDSLKLRKIYQKAVFCFSNDQSHPVSYHKIVDIPGEVKLPNGITVTANYTGCPDSNSDTEYICNKASVALPLHIRTRQNGDRMSWRGLEGSKKVKDIFIDAKIPLGKRDTWPVLTDDDGEILWLIGLKKGQPPIQAKEGTYIQLNYDTGNV